MNSVVCVKTIQDPEIPPAKFKIDSELKRALPPEGIPSVINPYDAQATELALQLKDKYGGQITVITVGNEASFPIVRHTLAMGADKGIILEDKAFTGSDSFSTAYILSLAIKKIEDYDLILCGRQAADWDEGLVGSILSENLNLPLVTLVEAVDVTDRELEVKRVLLDGYQVFAVPKPAVVTVSHEAGQPRLPSGWGIISASQTAILTWSAKDIEADVNLIGESAARRKLTDLFIPERERECEIIQGETAAEAAIKLAEKLREKGILQTS